MLSRENKLAVIIIVAFITLMFVVHFANKTETNLKETIEIQKHDIKVAQDAAEKLSDIEILESYTSSASRNAERYLEEIDSNNRYIESVKLENLELTEKYERSELRKRCNIEQMSRKAKGLEYDIEYCKNDEILEQFRTKKY